MPAHPDPFHGLFQINRQPDGETRLTRRVNPPGAIPDPTSGRMLRVATVEAHARAVCPSCLSTGVGGFVSFVADLRLVYACPSCEALVWLPGA
jgi:hypothetical protein